MVKETQNRYENALHIGLMTGTVLDGNIDVAFLRTDGKLIEEFGTII